MNTWTNIEMDRIIREAKRMYEAEGKVTQRGLARRLKNALDGRSEAAVYVKVREMMSAGRGWWSNKGIGRQITL